MDRVDFLPNQIYETQLFITIIKSPGGGMEVIMSASVNCRTGQCPEESKPLYFPGAIPGLDGYRHYFIEPVPGNPFFYHLRAAEEPEVGIILVDPFPFFEYQVDIPEGDCRELEAGGEEDLLVLTTVIIDGKRLFTNLVAPVIINPARRLGKQVILADRPGQSLRAELSLNR